MNNYQKIGLFLAKIIESFTGVVNTESSSKIYQIVEIVFRGRTADQVLVGDHQGDVDRHQSVVGSVLYVSWKKQKYIISRILD